jgi:hypothetical protein
MFEQEIELEKKQSGALPLLLMVGLIVVLVGVAVYFLAESRRVLANSDAAAVVTHILTTQEQPSVSFHTGLVKEGYYESPRDVRYKVLEKAGVITVGKAKEEKYPVALSAKGSELLKKIAGVKHSTDPDKTEAYVVPLAGRKLVEISKITMSGPERAMVEFTWQWDPNSLGVNFDASGNVLAGFTAQDRVTLIDKHGARFFHDAPIKVTIALVKGSQGWQPATE